MALMELDRPRMMTDCDCDSVPIDFASRRISSAWGGGCGHPWNLFCYPKRTKYIFHKFLNFFGLSIFQTFPSIE